MTFLDKLHYTQSRGYLTAAIIVSWLIAAAGLLLLLKVGFTPGKPAGLYERLFLGFELLWIALAISNLLWGRKSLPGERPHMGITAASS